MEPGEDRFSWNLLVALGARENYYAAERRTITDESGRSALLDTLARREAKAWLARHPN